MKKVLSIAVLALMMAGSTAFACDGCGCKDKKQEAKKECKQCEEGKKCKACEAKKGQKGEEKKGEKKCCGTCKKDK